MPEAVTHIGSGKVRELYEVDDERLLLVASDRISTFDVVLPTEIPDKGKVLTGLSAFWFARTREVCPNHLLGLRVRQELAATPFVTRDGPLHVTCSIGVGTYPQAGNDWDELFKALLYRDFKVSITRQKADLYIEAAA